MRSVNGEIVIPFDTPVSDAASVLIELRDISISDSPSKVISKRVLPNVSIRPGGLIGFQVATPEVDRTRTLSLRAHVSFDGSGTVKEGDLLTVANFPVSNTGNINDLRVEVAVI